MPRDGPYPYDYATGVAAELPRIVEGALENWPRREEWAPEPQPTRSVADEQIVDLLIKQGLRIHDAEDLSAAIIRIRRLTHYYYNEVEWEHIREHETRTFFGASAASGIRVGRATTEN